VIIISPDCLSVVFKAFFNLILLPILAPAGIFILSRFPFLINSFSEGIIERIYTEPYELDPAELELETELLPNEFLIIRSGKKSALAIYDAFTGKVKRIDKVSAYGITPRNAEQTFSLNALITAARKKWLTLSNSSGFLLT